MLAGIAFETARRREQPSEIALLLGLTRTGVQLVAVGGLLLPIFGLWLVHLGHFGYRAGWVDASIVLYVVALALALALGGVGGQRPKQARRGCSRAGLPVWERRLATSYAICSMTASRVRRTMARCSSCSRSSC